MDIRDFKRKNTEDIMMLENRQLADGSKFPMLLFHKFAGLPQIGHCFTTRGGGVSEGIFSSLNLSFTRGDERCAVEENYRRLAEALGTECNSFVFTDQTHTTNVRRVGQSDCMSPTEKRPFTDVDGLITDEPGVVLSTFFADCVPLYFVDVKHHAIGMSHSGWRGTVGRMGQKTLLAMQEEFHTQPEDVIAAIGPSICGDCYEVSSDVAEQFAAEFALKEQEILTGLGNGKYLLDLWKCNEIVLKEAGITQEHLAVTNICTCCNPAHLFSHRASNGKRGNLGAFLYLRKEKHA